MAFEKTLSFLLLMLFPMALESKTPENARVLGVSNAYDSRKGSKEEMREKINTIKALLDEVSALAEICGDSSLSLKACDSNPCLNGGTCVEEQKGRYTCTCAVGWKGDRCEVCNKALGMETGKILDDQINASSSQTGHQASRGRLNFEVSPGNPSSWSARYKNSRQWLQVDLGIRPRNVSGIATQGGNDYRGTLARVTRYKLQYSNDGVNFQFYKEQGQSTNKVFVGNNNFKSIKYHDLIPPIEARYIRFKPTNWKNWIAMRVELYGCQEINPCHSGPCLNGGNCTNEAGGNFSCQCPIGWTGDRCQKINPCHSGPCLNGGNCTNEAGGNFSCQCPIGWTGDRCQKINPCDSGPCLNGGNCTNEAGGSFSCQCTIDWKGDRCQNVYLVGEMKHSVILGNKKALLTKLNEWLKPVVQSGNWKLCWRATWNGWAAKTFHSLCDNKGPTVTIVKSGVYIFGGYTSLSWESLHLWRSDKTAFLFSLVNKPGWNPLKLPQPGQDDTSYSFSILDSSWYGPMFGEDLQIASQAPSNTQSRTNLGESYSPPPGHNYSTDFTRTFLAGHYRFHPSEVETYYESK